MNSREILPPGTVLDGKYRIDRMIGAGGFGVTYQAHDLGLNQPVAVKEYYPAQFGMRDGTFTVRPTTEKDKDLFDRLKESFLREARTLAKFRHPSTVRVVSVFEGHGTAYMVMEFESGKSLKSWLDGLGRRPTQAELDAIVMPLLDALEVMHNEKFLHRDIAPDNIIVRADGSPVLLDFGASRRIAAEMSGALTGIVKVGYSPPEQYANDPRVQGPWSDIYALGATLYRCVTGNVPVEATMRMLDPDNPVPPPCRELTGTGYRNGFLSAIDRAMMLRIHERPQSIAALRTLLLAGEAEPAAIAAAPGRDVLPGSGGWTRIALPPKSRISDSYADTSRGWRIGIGALAALSVLALVLAMMSYAGRRTEAVRKQEEILSKAEPSRSEQRAAEGARLRRELEAKMKGDSAPLQAEVERRRLIEEELRKATAASEAQKALQAEKAREAQAALEALKAKETAARSQQKEPAHGPVTARLEELLGDCPFCDDIRKHATPADFAELQAIPRIVEATWNEVRDRRGPRESAEARAVLEQLVNGALEPDPAAVIRTGQQKCTLYNFGFLDNAAERVGVHQCMVRMVRIGGNLASLTLEKLSGDGFFADFKPYRVNAMAALARSYLKGHSVTRYNLAVPKSKENANFGNAIGMLVSLNGKAALVSANQNGFTDPDKTFFSVLLLD